MQNKYPQNETISKAYDRLSSKWTHITFFYKSNKARLDSFHSIFARAFNYSQAQAACIGLLLCFTQVLVFQPVGAQSTYTGLVRDAQDQSALIGVNIVNQNQEGTSTDFDGAFEINGTPGDILTFQYLGYVTQEYTLTEQTNLDILLKQDVQILDDVIVVGYKKEVKSNVSTAISTIKTKNLENLKVSGLDQALQGQVSGLQVTQATGSPGDDIVVRIRGVGTIGNNNPLYIVDGVPATANINMFSTSDIESIQVLKDGAAASIYGARAANGVIIITTKRGKSGKPRFSLDTYYGIQQVSNLPDLLNAEEYLMLRNEAINNANTLRDPIRHLQPYDPSILNDLPDVDWLDQVFDPAPLTKVSLSSSGGSENSSFYINGEYYDQEGVFRGQNFTKYQLRFNGDLKNDWLTVGNNLSFIYSDRQVIGSSGDGAGSGNELSGIRYALIASPVFPIYRPDGSYTLTSSELGDPFLYGDGNANPLAFVDHTDWTVSRYRLFGNVFAQIDIKDNLTFKTTLGGDITFSRDKIFKERLSAAIYDPSSLSEGTTTERTLIWNNTLNYSHALGAVDQHNLSALVGMEAIDNRTEYLGASASNFVDTDPNFRYIDNSVAQDISDIGASGIATEWGLLSYFGQLGYNYDNRFIVNLSVRRDGSSRFGENNRWGTFPAASVAWNLSKEAFLANNKVISHLKLRASWGQLGNQEIGIYPYTSLVQTGRRVYSFGNQIATGASIVETGNQNIKWETTTQTDIGLEASFWQEKLSVMIDYYHKKSEDILVRVPLPQSAGDFNPPYDNAGEIENKGLEFSLNYRGSIGDLKYEVGGNISTVHNEVLSLANSEPILGGFGLSDGPITKTEPGYPVGSFFLYTMEGIFQSQDEIDNSAFQNEDTRPGDVKFKDINGDGIIDDKDRSHVGSPFPDFIYGLTANLAYKNFDLSILTQGIQGNDVYFLYGNFAYETQSRGFNSYRDLLNRWTPSNTNTDVPKVSFDDRNGNRRISTRFLEDGSYFRIRNVTLGYNLSDILNIESIRSLRIYFSAQNILTATNYPGLDPEIQANSNDTQGFNTSSDLAVGIDWGTVPAPSIYTFGANLTF